jgi:hypothetical protein
MGGMVVEFLHIERGHQFIFTSPQLPGWKCSGPSRNVAEGQCAGSLRCYLRNHPKLDPDIREALIEMVGPPGC